jgi:ABC-type multidrug transport system fused ATPase/permease subunit
MNKKEKLLPQLLAYAGNLKVLTYLSMLIAGISQLLALAPFLYIWAILRDVIDGDYSRIAHFGWMAVIFAIVSIIVYFGGLMCSHITAFRIAANMRKKLMHHIMTLPIGFLDSLGSGKVRKWVQESTQSTETYLAHQLPDKAGMYATMLGLAALVALTLVMVRGGNVDDGYLLNLLYYVIITPSIAVTLNRIMFASENEMIVAEALDKTGRILALDPLKNADDAKLPLDNEIMLKDVRFRYP